MSSDNIAQLVYLGLLVLAVGGWVMVEYRTRLGVALRTAMAWAMIFLGVMAGYGLWSDIKTDIIPRQMVAEGQIEVPRAQDGHYYLTLQINAEPVRFMADTGATNMVLSDADARRLGIDPRGIGLHGRGQHRQWRDPHGGGDAADGGTGPLPRRGFPGERDRRRRWISLCLAWIIWASTGSRLRMGR